MNRQITKIIKELSEELDFNVNFLSSNWIIELQKKEKIAVKKLEQKIPTFFMLKLMLTVVRFTFAALKV